MPPCIPRSVSYLLTSSYSLTFTDLPLHITYLLSPPRSPSPTHYCTFAYLTVTYYLLAHLHSLTCTLTFSPSSPSSSPTVASTFTYGTLHVGRQCFPPRGGERPLDPDRGPEWRLQEVPVWTPKREVLGAFLPTSWVTLFSGCGFATPWEVV